MRIGLMLLACLLIGLGGVAAEEKSEQAAPAKPLSPEQAADKVLTAVEAKDLNALKALAGKDRPDPWLVADELCFRGEHDAAGEFSDAVPRADLSALPAYLARRRDVADPPDRRAVLNRAGEMGSEPDKVLALLESFPRADDVSSVRALMALGHARKQLRRVRLAIESYVEAATLAETIGWLHGASNGLCEAVFSSEQIGDIRLAAALGERRVVLARKRGSLAELAFALQLLTWHCRNLRDLKRAHACLEESQGLFASLDAEAVVRERWTSQQLNEARTVLIVQLARAHWDKGEEADGVRLCRKAAAEYEKFGLGARAAQTRGLLGEHLMSKGDYRGAGVALARALLEYQKLKQPFAIAWVSGNLGWTHVNLGNYDEALTHAERAYKIVKAANSVYYMARTLGLIGTIRERKGEFEAALESSRSAVEILRTLDKKLELANALSDLGIVHWRLAQWGEAFTQLNESLRLQTSMQNKRGMAAALTNLGLIHSSLSDYGAAISCHERALVLQSELSNDHGRISALINLALAYAAEGRPADAIGCTLRALDLARAVGDRPKQATALGNLASVREVVGDYKRALVLHREALALKLEIGDRAGATVTRRNIGHVLRRLEEFELARAELVKARAESREEHDAEGEAEALLRLGGVDNALGRWGAARGHYEEAKRLHESVGLVAGVGWCHYNIGDALAGEGELIPAAAALERALATGKRLGERTLVVFSLAGLSRVHFLAGRHAEAIQASRAALKVVPEITGGLAQEQGASARSRFADVYTYGLSASALANDKGEFLHFMEGGRAGALLEALRGRASLRAWVVPKELEAMEVSVRRAEAAAVQRHRRALKQGALKVVRARLAELDQAREKVRDVVEKIRHQARAATNLIYPEPTTLAEVRGWLREREAFVLYAIMDDDLAALVVTPKESRIVRLGADDRIWEACSLLAQMDSETETADAAALLEKLIIEPLGLSKDVRLLVSPDGLLCYVPLALVAAGREVVYIPSATTYGHLTAERRSHGQGVLALGDPDYSTGRASESRTVLRSGSRLMPLPATRAEAKAVGQRVLLGGEASETNLRRVVAQQRWRAVHLACHGLVDPEHPMLSSLALTADKENDGYLTCLDVFRMTIPADLVVLSACETGKGKIYKTEGIVGLTRAFMFAGAPRVICSLWKVDDEATQALMIKFYELWSVRGAGGVGTSPPAAEPQGGAPSPPGRAERRRGMGAAEALQKAQAYVRDFKDKDGKQRWKHPYYWAAWVLWGLPD